MDSVLKSLKVFLKWHLKNIILLCFIDLSLLVRSLYKTQTAEAKNPEKKFTCIKIETKHPPNFEFPQHPQGHITNYRIQCYISIMLSIERLVYNYLLREDREHIVC